jgi:hypothetical protein
MSCISTKKVVITRRYIINPNWSKDLLDNHITIYGLQLADSSRPIVVDSIFWSRDPEYDPLETFVRDTCTWFAAFNIPYNGRSFRKRKIYFDRPNGFKWVVYSCDSLDSTYYKFWWWRVSPGFFDRSRDDSIEGRRRPQGFYTERGHDRGIGVEQVVCFRESDEMGSHILLYFVYVDSTGRTTRMGVLPPWVKPF